MSTHTPSGERGRRKMRVGPVGRWVMHRATTQGRRRGGQLMEMNVMVLHTVGRRNGQRRATPVSWFAEGDHAWLIVAVARRPARNPDWYYNLAANPDQVSIDVPHRGTIQVRAEQLDGDARAAVWQRIISEQPRYATYEAKTGRVLPVIRLTAV
ncbi:MAG TPA: nitroreductase/quinone reductase family protein [Jatrophihabitantaceae bacterium]|jgi:deazaflavin-dependent oxidoreductase (nitroreductase family)